MAETISQAAAAARACRICEAVLPLGPRPVIRVSATARLLIIGQAPGTKVHATGIPWNDPSGDRLRAWLDMPSETFYDQRCIAIILNRLQRCRAACTHCYRSKRQRRR